jgi:hypothetical protein
LANALATAWLDAPQFIPAALEQLAATGHGVAFVRALPAPTRRALLQRVIYSFGLAALQAAVDAPLAAPSLLDEGSMEMKGSEEGRPLSQAAPRSTPAPWRAVVTEASDKLLDREQQMFLGIGLMVRRAPTVARSQTFAQAVARWQRHEASPLAEDTPQLRQVEPSASPLPTPFAPPQPPLAPENERANALPTLPPSPLTAAPSPSDQAPSILMSGERQGAVDGQEEAQVMAPLPLLPEEETLVGEPLAEIEAASEESPLFEPLAAPEEAIAIETEFGGLFYLINVGIYLEYYADFTRPLERGIALNLYDFVAMIGAAWFGDALRADPLWALLATMAGRGVDDAPRHDFAPADGQTPASWFGEMLATVEARLVAALGLEEGMDEEPSLMPRLLCRHRARVAVSATHVDVYLSLADLPLEIRYSGLDRDAGWVPAAGRYLTFYFA